MTNAEFRGWLVKHDACDQAMKWLGERDERQAWEQCERGDWLLWLAEVAYPFVAEGQETDAENEGTRQTKGPTASALAQNHWSRNP